MWIFVNSFPEINQNLENQDDQLLPKVPSIMHIPHRHPATNKISLDGNKIIISTIKIWFGCVAKEQEVIVKTKVVKNLVYLKSIDFFNFNSFVDVSFNL